MDDSVYFLSDTHFNHDRSGTGEREKRKRFLGFLESIEGSGALYLVGDIFDFWFEYRSVIPRYYGDVISGLRRLSLSGTPIYVTGGNHDHWFGDYLPVEIGARILPPVSTHELQGRKVKLTHGDDLLPGDYGYKALKLLIRSRPAVAAARLVHPDLLYAFAFFFSRRSKSLTHAKTERCAERLIEIAPGEFFEDGNDAFITGHVHLPRIVEFGKRVFIILGDWERHFSWARLTGGEFFLEDLTSMGTR